MYKKQGWGGWGGGVTQAKPAVEGQGATGETGEVLWTGMQRLSSISPNGHCGRGDTERDTEQ